MRPPEPFVAKGHRQDRNVLRGGDLEVEKRPPNRPRPSGQGFARSRVQIQPQRLKGRVVFADRLSLQTKLASTLPHPLPRNFVALVVIVVRPQMTPKVRRPVFYYFTREHAGSVLLRFAQPVDE